MMKASSLLGFSMVPQVNRRRLVIITYFIVFAVTVAVIVFRAWPVVWTWFPLILNGVSGMLFGHLVEQTTLPQGKRPLLMGLGLQPSRREDGTPDERDLAIRNQAYFLAFRAMTIYALLLFLAIPLLLAMNRSMSGAVLWYMTIPLLVMALTLPQAILLWTEPDLPMES